MKILALEFSTDRRSLALLDTEAAGAATSSVMEVRAEGRATPTCAMLEAALGQAGFGHEAIEVVAVGLGPGSYAGIRAAIAFAVGWRLAREVRVVGVSSIECLAAQLHAEGERGNILVAVDAQRGEFYLAGYELGPAGWRELEPPRLIAGAELEARLGAGADVVGPDVPSRFRGVRPRFPDAATLARLAAGRRALRPDEALEPIYLRPVSFVKAPPPRAVP